jgi:hypothetical protein
MFDGQCWWITGASSGIGAALARALAAKGAHLILSGRNVAALEAVANDCADALLLPFEATEFQRIPAIAERAWSWKGRVDGLVNNAGISQRSLAVDTQFSVYEKMIAVDLLAPIAWRERCCPGWCRREAAGSSPSRAWRAGRRGVRSACCAIKHGLVGYDAVRAGRHLGIQVHVVARIGAHRRRGQLTADGCGGVSDSAIDNGIRPGRRERYRASRRKARIGAGHRHGHDVVILRRRDPEALFELMSARVRDGYAKKLAADQGGPRAGG